MNTDSKTNNMFNDKFQYFVSRKKTMTCMYPACEKKAVNSHSISKTGALYSIAEDGKLITPKSIRHDAEINKEIRLKDIGVNKASTFKGFCGDHESLFFDIDKRGIYTFRDIFCQIYRTTCKVFFLDNAIKMTENEVNASDILYNEKFERSKLINSKKVIHLFYDLLIDFPEAEQRIPLDKNCIYPFKPFSNASDLQVAVIFKKLNFKCPLALQTKFTLKKDKSHYDTFVIVVPSDNLTSIITISHIDELQYIFNHLRSDIDALCFIESVMMHDGDWYITPSVVQSWSPEKLKTIEDDYYFFTERKFLETYDVSIFDQIRRSLCKSLTNERRDAELKKINELPNRSSFEERERVLNDKMINDLDERNRRGTMGFPPKKYLWNKE